MRKFLAGVVVIIFWLMLLFIMFVGERLRGSSIEKALIPILLLGVWGIYAIFSKDD